MNLRVASFISVGAFACLTACGRMSTSESVLRIDDGIIIDKSSKNSAKAVFNVISSFGGSAGGCTGTAVSTDTLLFAAHCVENAGWGAAEGASVRSNAKVCVSNAVLQNECADVVYVPQQYANGDALRMAYDTAIAVFKRKPFAVYAAVASAPVKRGDAVTLVGYSDHGLPSAAGSSKRWGRNQVADFRSEITIVTQAGGSSDAVGVSPGDSGGPMFVGCSVVGVASRLEQSGSGKGGLHTNLTWSGNRKWLESASLFGGHVCGAGADAAFCPAVGRFVPVTTLPASEFPCLESPSGGGTAPPTATPDITSALAPSGTDPDALEVYLGVDATVASGVRICMVKNPSAASVEADCLSAPVGTSEQKRLGQRVILKAASVLHAPTGTATIGFLVLTGNGKKVLRLDRR